MRVLHASIAIKAALIAAAFALLSFGVGATAMPGGGHLYVAIGTQVNPGYGGPIYRYPLTNALPSAQPDLTIKGVAFPLATGPSGELYATTNHTVEVFALGSTTPGRSIIVPTSPGYVLSLTALAVDPKGYLYVAYQQFSSPDRIRRNALPTDGVLVYAPTASGHAHPLHAISISDYIYGLALDAQNDLYVSTEVSWSVLVYATPQTAPTFIRGITSPGITGPTGIAVDPAGELFVESGKAGAPTITSYKDTSNGRVNPQTTLLLPTFQSAGPGIAEFDAHLYVPMSPSNELLVYPRYAHGSASPYTIFTNGSPADAKVGL